VTHIPYASWCPICVKAKAKDDRHLQLGAEKQAVDTTPILQADYSYSEDGLMKILAVFDTSTGWGDTTVITQKGAEEQAVQWAQRLITNLAHEKVILRVDAEPALIGWANKVAQTSKISVQVQKAPRGSHQSNGAVERFHQTVQGQIRAMLEEFSQRYGGRPNIANVEQVPSLQGRTTSILQLETAALQL
jgi:hypothetical protein